MGLLFRPNFHHVAGTLYTYPDNFRAFKALVAAKYSGANVTVAKDFVFGETNKSAEFTKKFPLGKVPAFEGSDGTLLTESNAIAYYVANDELRGGSDAATRAQVLDSCAGLTATSFLPAAPGSSPAWESCSTTKPMRRGLRRISSLPSTASTSTSSQELFWSASGSRWRTLPWLAPCSTSSNMSSTPPSGSPTRMLSGGSKLLSTSLMSRL